MKLEDAIQEIKERWRELMPLIGAGEAKQNVNGEKSYICGLCGHGSHGDGVCCVKKDGKKTNTLHCFGCGFSGSVIDYFGKLYGINTDDTQGLIKAVKEMAAMINIDIDDNYSDYNLPPKPADYGKKDSDKGGRADASQEKPAADPPQDNADATQTAPERKPNIPGLYKNKLEAAADRLFSDAGRDALSYLRGRGLAPETLKKYKIGYEPAYYFSSAKNKGKEPNRPAITFPHSKSYAYFTARSLTGKFFDKPSASEAGDQPVYNSYALCIDRPCFVVEAAADALSILQAGGNACALIGTSWNTVLMPEITKTKPAAPLILCLDLDPPDESGNAAKGQKAQGALAAALDEKDIPYIVADFDLDKYTGEKDDPNSLMQANPEQFEADIRRITAEAQRATKPDNAADYILRGMQTDIDRLKQDAGRKTGFSNLDEKLGCLYAGLYVLGGISSVGKTTFVYQLADQLVEAGADVLFFSLEMSRLEMTGKSISRYSYAMNPENAVTCIDVRKGKKQNISIPAARKYLSAVNDRISIIEGNFNCDVNKITEYTKTYIDNNKVTPVIIIDYLQVMQPALDPQTGRKPTDPRIIADNNITALKRLSRELMTPIIILSSVNRSNYTAPLDFESFKESGGIEFTADVVLGLQLAIMSDDELFSKDKHIIEKREKVKQAKSQNPRKIELVCLKNRYGDTFSCRFDYFKRYDTFKPVKDGFHRKADDEKTPFDPEEKQETYNGLTVH